MDGVEERRRRARYRRWEEADLAAVDPAMDRIWRGRGGRGGRRGSNSAHFAWSRPESAEEEGEKGKELPLPLDLDPRTCLAATAAPRRGLAWPRRPRGLVWPRGLICLRGERDCNFASPLSSDAFCIGCLHHLLERFAVCTVGGGEAKMHLARAVEVSLRLLHSACFGCVPYVISNSESIVF